MVAIDYNISNYILFVCEKVMMIFNCSFRLDCMKNYLSCTFMFVENEVFEIRIKK